MVLTLGQVPRAIVAIHGKEPDHVSIDRSTIDDTREHRGTCGVSAPLPPAKMDTENTRLVKYIHGKFVANDTPKHSEISQLPSRQCHKTDGSRQKARVLRSFADVVINTVLKHLQIRGGQVDCQ